MLRKAFYLLVAGLGLLSGCGPAPIPPGAGLPKVVKTSSGGALLPGGVPLPPDAVKAGATKDFGTKR